MVWEQRLKRLAVWLNFGKTPLLLWMRKSTPGVLKNNVKTNNHPVLKYLHLFHLQSMQRSVLLITWKIPCLAGFPIYTDCLPKNKESVVTQSYQNVVRFTVARGLWVSSFYDRFFHWLVSFLSLFFFVVTKIYLLPAKKWKAPQPAKCATPQDGCSFTAALHHFPIQMTRTVRTGIKSLQTCVFYSFSAKEM